MHKKRSKWFIDSRESKNWSEFFSEGKFTSRMFAPLHTIFVHKKLQIKILKYKRGNITKTTETKNMKSS